MDFSNKQSFGDSDLFKEFPENCGIGVFNTLSSDGDSSDSINTKEDLSGSKLAIFCSACLPGYKPTYINENNKDIVV